MERWGKVVISLPNNTTTAALALVLGVLIGAGGCYYFLHEDQEASLEGVPDGPGVLERNLDRQLQPSDTSDQEAEPDLRVKYKRDTTVIRDTVHVPIPSNLSSTPAVSSRSPLEITEDRVTWTFFDPRTRQWTQQAYAVPQDNFFLRAHALVRVYAPVRNVSLAAERTWAGVGVSARWRRLEASVSALTSAGFERQRVSFGVRWRVW